MMKHEELIVLLDEYRSKKHFMYEQPNWQEYLNEHRHELDVIRFKVAALVGDDEKAMRMCEGAAKGNIITSSIKYHFQVKANIALNRVTDDLNGEMTLEELARDETALINLERGGWSLVVKGDDGRMMAADDLFTFLFIIAALDGGEVHVIKTRLVTKVLHYNYVDESLLNSGDAYWLGDYTHYKPQARMSRVVNVECGSLLSAIINTCREDMQTALRYAYPQDYGY